MKHDSMLTVYYVFNWAVILRHDSILWTESVLNRQGYLYVVYHTYEEPTNLTNPDFKHDSLLLVKFELISSQTG